MKNETHYCCYIKGCSNKLRNGTVVGKCMLHRNYVTCNGYACDNIFLQDYMKEENLCPSCKNIFYTRD